MRGDEQIRLLFQNPVQTGLDFFDGSSKSPVVTAHSWKAFLQTVDFPHLPGRSDQVAGESHAPAVKLNKISDGAVGMARSIENPEFEALPFVDVTSLQCARDRDRLSKRKKMGTKVVAMIEDVVGRIPEPMCFIKEHLLPDGNGHLGSFSNQTGNRRALISMMMGKQRPINHTASSRIDFSRVDQQGLAIAFEQDGVDRVPQDPQSRKNLFSRSRLRPQVCEASINRPQQRYGNGFFQKSTAC